MAETLLAFGVGYGVQARAAPHGDVRLEVLSGALVPEPWRGRLVAAAGEAWTERPRAGLPRLGFVHPLARELWRLALWDDEGQASANWRTLPGLPRTDEALFVKLRFLVGEDRLDTKLVQIVGDGAKRVVHERARRENEAHDTTLAWSHRNVFGRFVEVDLLEGLLLKALRAATGAVRRAAPEERVRCVAAELIAVSGARVS